MIQDDLAEVEWFCTPGYTTHLVVASGWDIFMILRMIKKRRLVRPKCCLWFRTIIELGAVCRKLLGHTMSQRFSLFLRSYPLWRHSLAADALMFRRVRRKSGNVGTAGTACRECACWHLRDSVLLWQDVHWLDGKLRYCDVEWQQPSFYMGHPVRSPVLHVRGCSCQPMFHSTRVLRSHSERRWWENVWRTRIFE